MDRFPEFGNFVEVVQADSISTVSDRMGAAYVRGESKPDGVGIACLGTSLLRRTTRSQSLADAGTTLYSGISISSLIYISAFS